MNKTKHNTKPEITTRFTTVKVTDDHFYDKQQAGHFLFLLNYGSDRCRDTQVQV